MNDRHLGCILLEYGEHYNPARPTAASTFGHRPAIPHSAIVTLKQR